jgi:hypothetical protein
MAVDAETLTPISPPSVGRIGAVGTGIRVVHRSRGTVPLAPVVAGSVAAVVSTVRVGPAARVPAVRRAVVVRTVRASLALVGGLSTVGRLVATPLRGRAVAPVAAGRVGTAAATGLDPPAAPTPAGSVDGSAADEGAAGEVVPAV